MEYQFKDFYQNQVKLTFSDMPYSTAAKHVWVICQYEGKWLLTHHKTRGLEFPGGKVELGEMARDAAIREVMEETGAVVEHLDYIAQYQVAGKKCTIIKNVYVAKISRLEKVDDYYETYGPVLLDKLPTEIKEDQRFSFMMKDDVLKLCINYIRKNQLFKK